MNKFLYIDDDDYDNGVFHGMIDLFGNPTQLTLAMRCWIDSVLECVKQVTIYCHLGLSAMRKANIVAPQIRIQYEANDEQQFDYK